MLERRIFIARHPSVQSIVRSVTDHPIDWGDRDKRQLHGLADQCGYPPTYAMAEFASCYNDRGRIPTQADFIAWCYSQPAWAAWLALKTPQHRDAYAHKLKGNFYPAAIDGLHVCALLYESGAYDSVTMSSEDDARLGVDVAVEYQDRLVKIDLKGVQTEHAIFTEMYRETSRPRHPDVLKIYLPPEFPKSPGNKRWFTLTLLRQHLDPVLMP